MRATDQPDPNTPDLTAPDLTAFTVIHRGMRVDSRRLARELWATIANPEPSPALATWVRRFIAEIHAHHHVEDTIFFPAVVERVPAAADLVGRLDVDHEALSRTLDELQAAFATGPARRSVADALRPAEELSDMLERHLQIEDDELLPLIDQHFTAAEFEQLDQRARRATPVSTLTFTVPWVLSHADDAELSRLLAQAGLPLRVLWWLTRRRFVRLASAAFGAPDGRATAMASAARG